MGTFTFRVPNKGHNCATATADIRCAGRNIGVLQTTVAEMVTVKEHQRESVRRFVRLGPRSNGEY